MTANLYRLFYERRHDPALGRRQRLTARLSGREFFGEDELKAVFELEGFRIPGDFGYLPVSELTRKAFREVETSNKIRRLRNISGVCFSAATALLAYQNPLKYAKIELDAYNKLAGVPRFGLQEKSKHSGFDAGDYEAYLSALKTLAHEHGMKPPDVEYALRFA